MARKLKVFRTPIGFHDAYVAAPSRKAALEAWGAGGDLFAQGIAEEVKDEQRMKAPLERPGEVIRVPRGSRAEQLAALGKANEREGRSRIKSGMTKAEPKPSREALDEAEQALGRTAKRQRAALRELERRHEREIETLRAARDQAKADFEAAMRRWKRAAGRDGPSS